MKYRIIVDTVDSIQTTWEADKDVETDGEGGQQAEASTTITVKLSIGDIREALRTTVAEYLKTNEAYNVQKFIKQRRQQYPNHRIKVVVTPQYVGSCGLDEDDLEAEFIL